MVGAGVAGTVLALWGAYYYATRKPAPPADGKQPPESLSPSDPTPPPSDGDTAPPPAASGEGEAGSDAPSSPTDAGTPPDGAPAIAVEEAAPFTEFVPPPLFYLLYFVGVTYLYCFVMGPAGQALAFRALFRIMRGDAPGEPTRIGAALRKAPHRLRRWWRP